MSDLKLGSVLHNIAAHERDAIHIAVAPVIAAELLRPGNHIGFVNDDGKTVGESDTPIGIVDPFLKDRVRRGECFWMFLYPNTITSLRHDWTHPAFSKAEAPRSSNASEAWLREYAERLDTGYNAMLRATEDYLKCGKYWREGRKFEDEYLPDEFWIHYENVTGTKVAEEDRQSFFSCSC